MGDNLIWKGPLPKPDHHCNHCGHDTLEERYVSVNGVWLRFIEGKAQVLAEVEGKWRLLMEESLDGNPTFSHIYEPLGIRSAPLDPLHDYELDTFEKERLTRGYRNRQSLGDKPPK